MTTPTEAEILARLNSLFCRLFDDESLTIGKDTTAADVPEWDSMMHVSITVAVESEFKVRFKTAEVESLKNVGDFVKLIELKLKAG